MGSGAVAALRLRLAHEAAGALGLVGLHLAAAEKKRGASVAGGPPVSGAES